MLTADMVRARRRGGRLELQPLGRASRRRVRQIAAGYVRAAEESVGRARAYFDQECRAVPVGVRDRKVAAGLRKLVEDRCRFEVAAEIDPATVRERVFLRASETRREAGPQSPFARDEVLRSVADVYDTTPEHIERLLYADLHSAHVLSEFEPITPERLLEEYELQQAQAVLLRAVHVSAEVYCRSPGAYRRLFCKLKFHRLLHSIHRRSDGTHRIEIDGPYSLFHSTTKYGLQLALMLPALQECDRWSLSAKVKWGKQRETLELQLRGEAAGAPDAGEDEVWLPDEVATLLQRFRNRATPWRVEPCTDVLSLSGVGECVPDLRFEHRETGAIVYFEALGYWSRQAVWRRIELVEQGLQTPIVFAVPRRLRVREDVLDSELPGALYVYKGTLHPGAVEERLAQLARVPAPDS